MNIKRMSNNKLDINIENVKEFKLFDLGKPAYSRNRKGGGSKNQKGRKFQSNRRRRFSK